MPVETVDIESGGDPIQGEVARPAGDTDHAAVLLPGGNHVAFDDAVFDRLAGAAAEEGVAFLRYESWADGDELQEKPVEDVHAELDAAVEYLEREYERITLVGKSAGGAIALGHVPDPVDDLILWAPAVFRESGSAIEAVDAPEDASLPTITPERLAAIDRPVAILQGDADHFPVANARELADALPEGSVEVIEGADHSFTGAGEDEAIATTLALLDRSADD